MPSEGKRARKERGAGGAGGRPSRAVLASLAGALTVGAVLRLRNLGGPPLWIDELVSWWAVEAPTAGDLLDRVGGCMATPALSFLAQAASVSVAGPSEWALRLPSALSGIAAIAVIFLAAWRTFGGAAAAASAWFLALHPFHLWWSVEARPYGMAVLLAAGSMAALSEMMRGPGAAAVIVYAVSTAALFHTQFVFLPLAAAQATAWGVLAATRRAGFLSPARAGAASGLTLLLSLPLLPQILRVAGGAGDLVLPAAMTSFPPGLFRLLQTTPLVTWALLFGAAAWIGPRRPRPSPGPDEPPAAHLFTAGACLLLPLVTLGLAALLFDLTSLSMPRYTAAYLPAAALLVGWLLSLPVTAGGRLGAGVCFAVLMAITGVLPALRAGESFSRDVRREDWRGALTAVRERLQPGDRILLRSGLIESRSLYEGGVSPECEPYVAATLSSFYLGEDRPAILLPWEFADPPHPPAYHRRIAAGLEGAGRVWLVLARPADGQAYYVALMRYLRESAGLPLRPAWSGSYGTATVVLLAVPDS